MFLNEGATDFEQTPVFRRGFSTLVIGDKFLFTTEFINHVRLRDMKLKLHTLVLDRYIKKGEVIELLY